MGSVRVNHVGMGKPGRLPTDMTNTGYWTQDSKDAMAVATKYVTAEEWAELANQTNASGSKHSALDDPIAMGCLFGTCGICFCPLVYIGLQTEARVNEDIAGLAITHKLKQRGITLHHEPKSKFDVGGLRMTFSAQTPPAPQPQQAIMPQAQPMAMPQPQQTHFVVPPGLQPGAVFVGQTPGGQTMQIVVPPGSKGGDTIAVGMAAAQQVMGRA